MDVAIRCMGWIFIGMSLLLWAFKLSFSGAAGDKTITAAYQSRPRWCRPMSKLVFEGFWELKGMNGIWPMAIGLIFLVSPQ